MLIRSSGIRTSLLVVCGLGAVGFGVIGFGGRAWLRAAPSGAGPVPAGEGLTTVFTYTDFISATGLTLNGSALPGQKLLLTPPLISQAGSAWYSNQVNVSQGFSTTFAFTITTSRSTNGDGIAFVIQNSDLSALGGSGSELGYGGIANSLAVEFDTFFNPELQDPNNNHLAIQSCGLAANTSNHTSCSLGLQANLPINLADGARHVASVGYHASARGGNGLFAIKIDGQLVLTSSVNLGTLLSLNGNDAWVGFTGGTGSSFETQNVDYWTFASSGPAFAEQH